jgi:SEC-C motif-containing protein
MRSRYSAFAMQDAAYLLRSWHPSTRPSRIDFEPGLRWEQLAILSTTGGTAFNPEGTVEFRADYLQGGHTGELHEVSRFVIHDGAWVYLTGRIT